MKLENSGLVSARADGGIDDTRARSGLGAAVFLALSIFVCAGVAAALNALPPLASAGRQAWASLPDTLTSAIGYGYAAAPALTLGVIFALLMPALLAGTAITTRINRADNATRRFRGRRGKATTAEIDDVMPAHFAATIELVGGETGRVPINRDMMRIGREDDNDVRIPSAAVHRYHAAIHRAGLEDWHITDLSGTDGNGVVVNGQPCGDAVLRDGDVIDLGPGRLRFRSAPRATHAYAQQQPVSNPDT